MLGDGSDGRVDECVVKGLGFSYKLQE